MNYIIFDLEATCWEDNKSNIMETIEIGAVKLNKKLEPIGEFNSFVKPILTQKLSRYCTNLTSIKQEDIENAETFPKVQKAFFDWCTDNYESNYWLCSWGFYDRKQLKNDCDLHKIDTTWIKPHVSLKHQYSYANKAKPIGLASAIHDNGFIFEGTHHRGICDARNIAKIFIKNFNIWKFK